MPTRIYLQVTLSSLGTKVFHDTVLTPILLYPLVSVMSLKMSVLLCLLLWSLVEVHSQTEFPYVTFMGETLANHSYVKLTEVGTSSGTDTVRCITDLTSCCGGGRSHRGDWYFPNGTRLLFVNSANSIYE